jgi:hypothetical protein
VGEDPANRFVDGRVAAGKYEQSAVPNRQATGEQVMLLGAFLW